MFRCSSASGVSRRVVVGTPDRPALPALRTHLERARRQQLLSGPNAAIDAFDPPGPDLLDEDTRCPRCLADVGSACPLAPGTCYCDDEDRGLELGDAKPSHRLQAGQIDVGQNTSLAATVGPRDAS